MASGPLQLQVLWLLLSSVFSQQEENIALRKSYNQSSFHPNHGNNPSHAANGNTSGYFDNHNCIDTKLGDRAPFWQVDLGQVYPVLNITIFGRTSLLNRLVGVSVSVDDRICTRIQSTPTSLNSSLSCTTTLYGQLVKLEKYYNNSIDENDNVLSVCEVQIWVCSRGFYGHSCNRSCGKCSDNSDCDRYTGDCRLLPCQPGYTGSTCHECPDYTFGQNCSSVCGRCQDNVTCQKVNGHCPSGCTAGWTGPRCHQECPDYTFGQNCSSGCGRCQDNVTCEKVNGHCPSGCTAGWTGPHCHQACPVGFYGDGCNQTCERCRHQQDCHHLNGFCMELKTRTLADGVVVGIIVAIIVVAVVIVLIVRKRRLQQHLVYNDRLAPPHPADESHTPDVHYINNMVTPTSSLPVCNDEYATVAKAATLQTHPNRELRQRPGTPDPLGASDVYVNLQTKDLLTAGGQTSHPDARVHSTNTSKADGVSLRMLKMEVEKKLRFIDDEFSKLPSSLVHDCQNGSRKENNFKNRFNSILPYDFNRVVLEKVKGDDSSDYINASFINGYKRDKAYIAAQGPKNNTVDDFWRMVWQENVTQIIMLTNVFEKGKSKCFEYWPAKGENHVYGQVEVTCAEEDKRAHFVLRTLHVKPVNVGKFRLVEHLHYVDWKDHKVPSITALTDFWKFAKCRNSAGTLSPPLVHCSAGVGRTGTYIALDIVMKQATQDGAVHVLDVVQRLRDDRCCMVHNKEQYSFLYEVVLEAYSSLDTGRAAAYFDMASLKATWTTADDKAVDTEFQNLQLMRDHLEKLRYTISTSSENRDKNRNMNALPSDNHLVYLTAHVRGRNNYISAVFAPTVLDARGAILTQLPLPDTVQDIWRLVESYDVSNIVSLGSTDCLQKNPCSYWPKKEEEKMMTENYTVTLLAKAVLGVSLQSYSLKWERKDKHGEVRLLSLSDWRDEVPGNGEDLVHLLQLLLGLVLDTKSCPVVFQCIDGAAKSGLLCVLCNIITQMTSDHTADIFMKVREMQAIRPEVVTSLEEYRFCYEVVHRFQNSQCF